MGWTPPLCEILNTPLVVVVVMVGTGAGLDVVVVVVVVLIFVINVCHLEREGNILRVKYLR